MNDRKIEARTKLASVVREVISDLPLGRCFMATFVGYFLLRTHYPDVHPVAGSLQWRAVPKDQDDGVCNTHFSYMFDATHPTTLRAVLNGNLPEMHVWLYVASTNEIIDFTTFELKQKCDQCVPDLWKSPEPIPYLWEEYTRIDATDMLYRPDRNAVNIIRQYMCQPNDKMYELMQKARSIANAASLYTEVIPYVF